MIVSTQGEIMGELDLSENRFRSLFMAAPLGIGVTSRDGRLLVYNDLLVQMSGYSPEEFKPLNVQDLYANLDDRVELMKILEAAGVVRGYETSFSRKDNSIFNVNMSIIPIKYGAEDALLTILEDISERKQAELERQEELDFRKLLVDSSPIFFMVVNAQGETTMMNKSMLEVTGYEWEQVRGADYINTFVPEREQPAVLKVIEEVFEQKQTTLSENNILTKTGQELLVEWHACPIINSENKIEFIFAYGVDITERKKAENSLKESAERHRVFFKESPLLNWQFDLNPPMPINLPLEEQIDWILHKTILVDANLEQADSRSDADVALGLNLYENWGENEEFGSKTIREFIIQNYSLKMYETQEYTSLGELIWSIINAFGVIKDGHLSRIWGTTLDITNRKQVEEELRESEDKFQKVFMSSPYSMTIARLEDGIIVDVNEGFEKNLGYSREEVIGHTAIGLGLLKDPNTLEKRDQIIAVEGNSRDLELRLIHKDGRELISLVSTMIIELKGEPYRVSIGKDITDLRESELRYRMLFENASDAIFVLRDNRVIDCNSSIESMFGYTKEEAIGMHPGEVSPQLQPDGRESISKAEALIREISVDSPLLYEWVHQRKDGSEFTAEVKLHQIVVQDERLSLAVLRDTTERKLGEEAAQEERQRLAHELHDAVSQTLFSASTIAQTLERTWDDNPDLVYQNLGELQILTQGALAEMRNLLLELRPGALEHIPMPDLLRQLVEGFSGRTKTEIELSILEDHPLSYNVRFVFFRLAQEALNNIIKHARANQVQVNYDSQPDQVQLTIEDDGRGFDPSIISPGRHGLEIMKERAEKINATIHIKSQVGDGTTVSINWRPREVPR